MCVIGILPARGIGAAIYPELEGAWESKYIGTRIEINENHLIVLHMNRIVLDTTFEILEDGKIKYLKLQNNGLRYNKDKNDYATIDKLYLKDNQLYFDKTFKIVGAKSEILSKTNNSRYGDVTIVDEEVLPQLQGFWKALNSDYILGITDNTLICRYKDEICSEVEIIVVQNNDESDPNFFFIINKDPAIMEGVGMFTKFTHQDDKLIAYELILDADSPRLEFEKIK